MSKTTNTDSLIVAASENDADMLYATRFFAPDAFIFLEQNGKRTLVLSDLEIDRGRKQASADEFLPYSEFEKEVQGERAQGSGLREGAGAFPDEKKSPLRASCPRIFRSVLRASLNRKRSGFSRRTASSGRSAKRKQKRNCA